MTCQCLSVSEPMPDSAAIAVADVSRPLGGIGHETFVVDVDGFFQRIREQASSVPPNQAVAAGLV